MSMIGIRGLSGYSHWKLFAADCNQVAGPLAASAARALAFAFNGALRPHSPLQLTWIQRGLRMRMLVISGSRRSFNIDIA